MARVVKLKGSLRFRETDTEPRTEQQERNPGAVDKIVSSTKRELTPFQRVKFGAGECFLAAEAIPSHNTVN